MNNWKYFCHHCGKDFEKNERMFEIGNNFFSDKQNKFLRTTSLKYHEKCFEEIAGKSFVDKLISREADAEEAAEIYDIHTTYTQKQLRDWLAYEHASLPHDARAKYHQYQHVPYKTTSEIEEEEIQRLMKETKNLLARTVGEQVEDLFPEDKEPGK